MQSSASSPQNKFDAAASPTKKRRTSGYSPRHDLLERDASISRNDFGVGNNLHFNETVFITLANANPGVDYYKTTSAGEVQHARLPNSIAGNPNVTNTAKEFIFCTMESTLYLSEREILSPVSPVKYFLPKGATPHSGGMETVRDDAHHWAHVTNSGYRHKGVQRGRPRPLEALLWGCMKIPNAFDFRLAKIRWSVWNEPLAQSTLETLDIGLRATKRVPFLVGREEVPFEYRWDLKLRMRATEDIPQALASDRLR
ncbi:hypothetical protein DFH09DRAFT_1077638 [Mycena vulgaris]|nr:hypothetical protein DFH09DRAFT_1077638 [Mycena vulgaris]